MDLDLREWREELSRAINLRQLVHGISLDGPEEAEPRSLEEAAARIAKLRATSRKLAAELAKREPPRDISESASDTCPECHASAGKLHRMSCSRGPGMVGGDVRELVRHDNGT